LQIQFILSETPQKLSRQNDAENNFMAPVMIGDDEKTDSDNKNSPMHISIKIFIHFIVVVYFSYATYNYISTRECFILSKYNRNQNDHSCRRQMYSRM
jgi:hypothetical protein